MNRTKPLRWLMRTRFWRWFWYERYVTSVELWRYNVTGLRRERKWNDLPEPTRREMLREGWRRRRDLTPNWVMARRNERLLRDPETETL